MQRCTGAEYGAVSIAAAQGAERVVLLHAAPSRVLLHTYTSRRASNGVCLPLFLYGPQDVNPVSRKARIVYTSGEVEELDLEEIAKDKHMSLIPPEFYGAMGAS
jgi:hypothetical protein